MEIIKSNKFVFEPFWLIGKILFFDRFKNNFGFITDVVSNRQLELARVYFSLKLEEVRFSGNETLNSANIIKGKKVAFLLNKGSRGYFATNVSLIADIEDSQAYNYLYEFITEDETWQIINNVFRNYSNDDKTPKLNPDDLIIHFLNKEKSTKAWLYISKIGSNESIKYYIDIHLAGISDGQKVDYLLQSFNYHFFKHIVKKWTSKDSSDTKRLIVISSGRIDIASELPDSFKNELLNIDWHFEDIWEANVILNIKELSELIPGSFSFTSNDFENHLVKLESNYSHLSDLKSIIRHKIIDELPTLKSETLLDIFEGESNKLGLIKDENELILFLKDKKIDVLPIRRFFNMISDLCDKDHLKSFISCNLHIIDEQQCIILLGMFHKEKPEICKIIIEVFFNNNINRYRAFFELVKKHNSVDLCSFFIEKFAKQLSQVAFKTAWEMALFSNNDNAKKVLYQNIKVDSEEDFVFFYETVSENNDYLRYKKSNAAVTEFIAALNSPILTKLSPEIKNFLKSHSGVLQCLLIKNLVKKAFETNVSKKNLMEVLEDFSWTEISAILIITFLNLNTSDNKIVVENLNFVFKEHFCALQENSFKQKDFINNFSIGNILHYCNGRKFYNANFWQKNNVSRWYVDGQVSILKKDTYNQFCEGRPWKKESFWDSKTNKPSSEKYDFYWCKGSYCAARNDDNNIKAPFWKWTIYEIAKAYNISLEVLVLSTLAGWANRMNQILNHLFCRKCNEILRPLAFKPKYLGINAVPVFNCVNNSCSEYGKSIRFTHCLNGKCPSHIHSEPLDSRDCESCMPSDPRHTGLLCNYCNSSCPACQGRQSIEVQEYW